MAAEECAVLLYPTTRAADSCSIATGRIDTGVFSMLIKRSGW
jgi:hypothetical protein